MLTIQEELLRKIIKNIEDLIFNLEHEQHKHKININYTITIQDKNGKKIKKYNTLLITEKDD